MLMLLFGSCGAAIGAAYVVPRSAVRTVASHSRRRTDDGGGMVSSEQWT